MCDHNTSLLFFLLLLSLVLLTCGAKHKTPNLENTRLSRTYRRRLELGWEAFDSFCQPRGQVVASITSSRLMSQLLVDLIQWSFEAGSPHWIAKHAVLAAQTRHRDWRGRLRRPWDAIPAWRQHLPVGNRTPVTEEVVRCLWALCWEFAGLSSARAMQWLLVAWLVRLSFYALLRPGEVTQLTVDNLMLSSVFRLAA